MGLLDDAIREHLELKRRHGADPSEVARQEQEALGPPRRGAAMPDDDGEPFEGGAVSVGLAEDDVAAAAEPPPAPPPADAPAEEPPAPSQPVGEPEAPIAPPAPVDEPPDREDARADVRPVEPPPAPEELRGDPERDPAAPPRDDDPARDDVLEETPDFLQETPEHERLWFEQKPPRDFDF
jgi:hypothetical protein